MTSRSPNLLLSVSLAPPPMQSAWYACDVGVTGTAPWVQQ